MGWLVQVWVAHTWRFEICPSPKQEPKAVRSTVQGMQVISHVQPSTPTCRRPPGTAKRKERPTSLPPEDGDSVRCSLCTAAGHGRRAWQQRRQGFGRSCHVIQKGSRCYQQDGFDIPILLPCLISRTEQQYICPGCQDANAAVGAAPAAAQAPLRTPLVAPSQRRGLMAPSPSPLVAAANAQAASVPQVCRMAPMRPCGLWFG